VKHATETATRIVGIDPGLNITGYAVIEKRQGRLVVVEAGMIRGRTRGDLAARLQEIHDGVSDVIASLKPEALAIEELYSHYERPRTAILMGHARGVICLAARLASIPVMNFPVKRVKQSVTGNGNASKTQVQRAVQNFFSLARAPHPPDVADALAVAMCHATRRAMQRRLEGARA